MKSTQTEKLIRHLRSGKPINFLEAYYLFGIQDLRKRLMEVREAGYRLRALKERDTQTGRRIHCWRLDSPLFKEDFVRVTAAPTLPNGTHPLFGREGVVVGESGHLYTVGDLQTRQPFGRFLHQDLLKIAKHGMYAEVSLRPGSYTVRGYDPQTRNYILQQGENLFYAPDAMLQSHATTRTDSRGFTPCS